MKYLIFTLSTLFLVSLFFNVLFYLAHTAPDWTEQDRHPIKEQTKNHLTLVKK